MAAATYLSDMPLIVPRIDSGSYVSGLVELCSRYKVKLLIPTLDTELNLLSQARNLFEAVGTTVCVSSPEVIRITSDKVLTRNWLIEQSVRVPNQVKEGESLDSLTLNASGVVLKPVAGSRSVGVSFHSKFNVPKVVPEGYVAQQLILGEEFTVSAYVNRAGNCVAAVPRLRLEVRDGEVSKAMTVSDFEMENSVAKVVEALPGAWGPLNVQFIKQEGTGELFLIEINARIGGGDPLAWVAGCDIPDYLLREVYGGDLPALDAWLDGATMLRFDQAVYLGADGEPIYVG